MYTKFISLLLDCVCMEKIFTEHKYVNNYYLYNKRFEQLSKNDLQRDIEEKMKISRDIYQEDDGEFEDQLNSDYSYQEVEDEVDPDQMTGNQDILRGSVKVQIIDDS